MANQLEFLILRDANRLSIQTAAVQALFENFPGPGPTTSFKLDQGDLEGMGLEFDNTVAVTVVLVGENLRLRFNVKPTTGSTWATIDEPSTQNKKDSLVHRFGGKISAALKTRVTSTVNIP